MTEAAPGTTPTPAADPASGQGGDGGQQAEYTPPATQAELDKIVGERLARQKAQFKDYDTFKAAAEELAQIKAANQTEAERQAEELSRLQAEAETWRNVAVAHRAEALATSRGFIYPDLAIKELDPSRYLDASGQINEALLTADIDAVAQKYPDLVRAANQPRVPGPNHAQGTGGNPPPSDPRREFAALWQAQTQ